MKAGKSQSKNRDESVKFMPDEMKDSPQIFAVFGNPVKHSLSPLMHNAAYREMGLNAVYIPFCVENLAEAVSGIRGLPISGVSVTIPFKTVVMDLLDEVDEDARIIGAVNTIRNDGGRLTGFNTDWIGLALSLASAMEIEGKRFTVLGAGGAARAVVFALLKKKGNVTILNRTRDRGEKLAREFGCEFRPLVEASKIRADCLINTTSVGMAPREDESPFGSFMPGDFGRVVDIIYNPLKTKLLADAEAAGCSILNGLDMFVLQGAEQIRLWTGEEPPEDVMKSVVLQALGVRRRSL
jgi:shikimate dehydrogenase